MPELEANKTLATRYLQAWATRDAAEFEAILSPDFADYMMGKRRTRTELLADAADRSLNEISQEVEAILAEGDKVAVKYTTSAVLTATGQPLKFTGMFILTVAGGQVTGGWGQFDRFGIREQLAAGASSSTPVAQFPPREPGGNTSSGDSKELCQRYFQAWNSGDLALFEELLAPNFIDYMMGQPRTRAELFEQVASQAANRRLRDVKPRVDVLMAEGDLAALHYTINAIDTTTGSPVSWTGMFIVTTADGRVTGGWGERDTVTIREQLAAR